jgi:RHS repeat-associated protein
LILATAPNIYGIETFAYDPLDNLRHSQIGTVTFDYLLDSNGKNRLDQINIDGQPFLDYASNEQGDTTRRNRIPSDWIFANGFEESPSLRQAMLENTATTQELVYDRAHRLTGVGNTPGLADIEQYMYDAHGHRVATVRASDGLKRYQVYSKAGELLFTQDHRSNEIAEYVNLDGSLVARRTQPIPGGTLTVTYSHTDMRGTPVVETSAAGTPSPDRTILAPYGAPYSGVYREGPSFTGHATDATTGLSYMQQRYYDPIAARFLSVDPIAADAVSFGRYWYANNNPIKYIDPNGRKGELAMERFAEDVGRNPETYQYMVAPAAVVTGAALVATVGAVVASFAASNPAAANELGIAMMEALSGDALGPTSVAVAGMALNASADGVIKLFHQGRLVDGQVSSTRALSTSLSSDLNHYNPSGELNEFHVPSSTFDGWENSGLIEYRRDMHQPSGSVTEEILIMPPASGELNEYIQPR